MRNARPELQLGSPAISKHGPMNQEECAEAPVQVVCLQCCALHVEGAAARLNMCYDRLCCNSFVQ